MILTEAAFLFCQTEQELVTLGSRVWVVRRADSSLADTTQYHTFWKTLIAVVEIAPVSEAASVSTKTSIVQLWTHMI